MIKKILVFLVALISFVVSIPAYAAMPTEMEIFQFNSRFFDELGLAEQTLDTRFVIARGERVEKIRGLTAVVGDLHGDLFTFRAIRNRLTKDLHEGRIRNVVFLGDIMDRGENSAYTLLELLEFFNEFPEQVYIIRGNHETMDMFEYFPGDNPARNDPYFKDIDHEVFKVFFDKLPYALVINGHTLAAHGGIPSKNLWKRFFGTGLPKEGSAWYDVVKSVTWSDYSPYGDAVSINKSRTDFDRRLICYSERDVLDFFRMWSVEGIGTCCEDIARDLKYLIRAHQPSLGSAFHQSPNQIVTTVFGAIENQSERFMRDGIKVALVTEDDVPPVPYFAVYSHGGESRECIECPYFCSEERSDSDFHYDPRAELECAFYEDENDDEFKPGPEACIEPMYPHLRRPSLAFSSGVSCDVDSAPGSLCSHFKGIDMVFPAYHDEASGNYGQLGGFREDEEGNRHYRRPSVGYPCRDSEDSNFRDRRQEESYYDDDNGGDRGFHQYREDPEGNRHYRRPSVGYPCGDSEDGDFRDRMLECGRSGFNSDLGTVGASYPGLKRSSAGIPRTADSHSDPRVLNAIHRDSSTFFEGVEIFPEAAGRNSALRTHGADRYSSTRTPTSRGGSSVTLAPVEIGMEPMGSSTSSGTTKTSMGGYSAGYRRTYK